MYPDNLTAYDDEDRLRIERAQRFGDDPDDGRADSADKGEALMALCHVLGVPYDPTIFRNMSDKRVSTDVLRALVFAVHYRNNPPEHPDDDRYLRTAIAAYAPADAGPNDVPKAGGDE